MAGERYGYSIDVGKELENDQPKQEEKKEEPKKEDQPAPAQESPPAHSQEQPAQKPQIPLAPEPQKQETQQPEQPRQEPAPEQPADELYEEEEPVAQEPQGPPDPVEEDINAIITREFPELNAPRSVWERIIGHRALIITLLFIALGGWFAFSLLDQDEPQREAFQPVQPPMALAVMSLPENISNVLSEEPAPMIVPEFEMVPSLLAEQLRD